MPEASAIKPTVEDSPVPSWGESQPHGKWLTSELGEEDVVTLFLSTIKALYQWWHLYFLMC